MTSQTAVPVPLDTLTGAIEPVELELIVVAENAPAPLESVETNRTTGPFARLSEFPLKLESTLSLLEVLTV